MEYKINTFSKGMNKDAHPSTLQDGQYVNARNAVLFSSESGNFFTLNNEPGFLDILNNTNNFENNLVLGMCSIQDRIICFSLRLQVDFDDLEYQEVINNLFPNNPIPPAEDYTNFIDYRDAYINNNAISSEVGVFEPLPEGSYNYRVVVNDKDQNYWQDNNIINLALWNFNPLFEIDCLARVTPDQNIVVYWTDDFNPPRYLNIDFNYTDEARQFSHLADQTRLFDVYNLPIIRFNNFLSNGSLPLGVYQFAVRYLNETLDPTTFGYICHPIPVTPESRNTTRFNYDGGPFDAPPASKSIELTVHNIDQEYRYVELAAIRYTGLANVPEVLLVQRYIITGSQMTLTFTGEFEKRIDLQDLLREPLSYRTARCINQKDGRLILSNLAQEPTKDIQFIANRLRLNYYVQEIPFTGDDGDFSDYKEEGQTFEAKGYRRGETYSFALVAVLGDGSRTYAHTIPGNPNVPAYAEPVPGDYSGEQELVAYQSDLTYPPTPVVPQNYYTDKDGNLLNGEPILHHIFPNSNIEPHVSIDENGVTWIRIMGIRMQNLQEILDDPNNEFNPEQLNLIQNIKEFVLVRQSRDTLQNRSVYAQGCLNPLMKHQGRQLESEQCLIIFVRYLIGFGEINLPVFDAILDIVLDVLNSAIESIYTILENEGIPGFPAPAMVDPPNILPSYCIDPFFGDTTINRYNSGAAVFINGDFADQPDGDGRNYYGLFTPETNFIGDYKIPNNSILTPVLSIKGRCNRILNTRLNKNFLFSNGSYSHLTEEPYNATYRGPYYHLFANFDGVDEGTSGLNNYIPITSAALSSIIESKKTRWNQLAADNGVLYSLNTRIIEGPGADPRIKLNNYENEGFTLLKLNGPLITPPTSFEVEITIGCTFNLLFIPAIPINVWNKLKGIVDNFEPADGFGGTTLAKIVLYISSTIAALGLTIAISLLTIGGFTGVTRVAPRTDNLLGPLPVAFLRRNTFAGENNINFDEDEEIDRRIYNITTNNTTQYGNIDANEYYQVGVFYTQQVINNTNDDTGVLQALNEPVYNGDTFITKYFWKNSYNLAYKILNLDQSEPNRKTIDLMFKDLPTALLAIPGGILAMILLGITKAVGNGVFVNEDFRELLNNLNILGDGVTPSAQQFDPYRLESDRQLDEEIVTFLQNIDEQEDTPDIDFNADDYWSTEEPTEPIETPPGSGNFQTTYQFTIVRDGQLVPITIVIQRNDDVLPHQVDPFNPDDITIVQLQDPDGNLVPFLEGDPEEIPPMDNIAGDGGNFDLEGIEIQILPGPGPGISIPPNIPLPTDLVAPVLDPFLSILDVLSDSIFKNIEEEVVDPLFPNRNGASLRSANWVWLESSINTEYRHRPINYTESEARAGGEAQFNPSPDPNNARQGVPYFPKDSPIWCFEVTPEFGQSNGYNVQYSFENKLRIYRGVPFGNVEITDFPTRSIYSEPIDQPTLFGVPSKSELSDKYRQFLPFSYQDIPKDKGEITNVFEQSGELYIQTPYTLYKSFFNSLTAIPASNEQELILGNGGVFARPPIEVFTLNGGYAGTSHKLATCNTPFGYFFVDAKQRKVFLYNGELNEISNQGMYSWFKNNIVYDGLTQQQQENVSNPVGIGMYAFYDPEYKRIILTIRNRDDTLPNFIDDAGPQPESFVPDDDVVPFNTLSFYPITNHWTSFHDYRTVRSVNVGYKVYSVPNVIPNSLFIHNQNTLNISSSTGNFGNYGVFYQQDAPDNFIVYPFELEFSTCPNPIQSSVFDSLSVIAEFIDEGQGTIVYGEFFNTIQCFNEVQATNPINIIIYPYQGDLLSTNCKLYNNQYQIKLPHSHIYPANTNIDDNSGFGIIPAPSNINIFNPNNRSPLRHNRPRFKSKYLIIKLIYNNQSRYGVNNIPNSLSVAVNAATIGYRISNR